MTNDTKTKTQTRSNQTQLGKLEREELRNIWATEDRDFTPWLAQEDSLELLGNILGMDLELEAQEKEVGPFRADILCKSKDDESWVLIENQIERTDHKHLGQLLTYAAGLEAVTIVWVASKFTDEHRAALDWLNKITDDNFRFFGLEVELWKIGNSVAAPKFNIISQPNTWSKSIAQAAKRLREEPTTEVRKLQYEYWQALVTYLQKEGSQLKPATPSPQAFMQFRIGSGKGHIGALLNTQKNLIGVELCITDRKYAKNIFHMLAEEKPAIETEIGKKLIWLEKPERITSKIQQFEGAILTEKADWPRQHAWHKDRIKTFDRVFRQRVGNFDSEQWDVDEED